MRSLVLLATGGTIATTAAEGGRRVGVGADRLLEAASEIWGPPPARVRTQDKAGIVSFAATTRDTLALARSVREAAADADAIVVTHGTDTTEEASFLLSLVDTGSVPVVFTGAQRPFDDAAPDGPRNLAAALRWAADPRSDGTGVTVVFNDTILPAVGVRKVHTLALSAFSAPDRTPLGTVDEVGVRRYAAPAPVPALLGADVEDLPRVDVVSQYLGADDTALRAVAAQGTRGVVLAGFGAGNATPSVTEASLELMASGMPVVLASRVGAGAVAGLYAGGGADLVAAGAVPAGDLSPWQARLLLAAVLADEPEPDRQEADRRCREWLEAVGATASTGLR